MTTTTRLRVENLSKTFVLHHQNSIHLPVLAGASLEVNSGECVVLHGHSGSGKSTLLRSLYANYLPDEGSIWVNHQGEWLDMVQAPARQILADWGIRSLLNKVDGADYGHRQNITQKNL